MSNIEVFPRPGKVHKDDGIQFKFNLVWFFVKTSTSTLFVETKFELSLG